MGDAVFPAPRLGVRVIETLTVTVYRGEDRRKRFTKTAAINGTAWARFKKKHPCQCEQGKFLRCGSCLRYRASMFEGRGYSNGPYLASTRAQQIVWRYARILRRNQARSGAA